MLITHSFYKCINCKTKIEILDKDLDIVVYGREKYSPSEMELECPECGYSNSLYDERLKVWEEEF